MNGDMLMPVYGERNWLIGLVEKSGRAPEVTDAGFSLAEEAGDFVYETGGRRYEVTVKELR